MIIKEITHSHRNYKALISYVLSEHEQAEVFMSKYIRNTSSIEAIVQSFKNIENRRQATRRSNSTIMRHTIMSFGEGQNPPDSTKLKKLIRKYGELYPKTVMIGAIHDKGAAKHIHLVYSGLNIQGESNRTSIKDFQAAKALTQELQLELGIEHSIVDHAKKKNIHEFIKTQK